MLGFSLGYAFPHYEFYKIIMFFKDRLIFDYLTKGTGTGSSTCNFNLIFLKSHTYVFSSCIVHGIYTGQLLMPRFHV